ncbi:MAG: type 4a pilus biogenesis protein PilO [Pirellulales bacterium]|nr:type 4a pilus biogenesis protein PilO [Pirellulales bacterium]
MSRATLQHLAARPWAIHALGGSLLAVLAATIYVGCFVPCGRDMARRAERMKQLEALLSSKEQIAEEHARLKKRLDSLRTATETTLQRMPLRSPSQEFIERAGELATLHDLKMEMCTASAPQSYRSHSQVEVTCRLSGGYARVCRFLAAIDQLSQISKVSRFEMSSGSDSDAYPTQIVFQLYYRSELHDTEKKQDTL